MRVTHRTQRVAVGPYTRREERVVKLATGSSKFIPTLLLIGAVFFIVKQPEKAAVFATNAMNALVNVADSLATFLSKVG